MTERRITELRPHTLNKDIYGDNDLEDEFVQSIADLGILTPLTVLPDGMIISGHRRWRAAKELGLARVPIQVCELTDELEIERAMIESNRQREKTFSQKMREAEELERIESALARERQKELGRTHGKPLADGRHIGGTGETADKVAKGIGISSGRQYYRAKKVWQAAKSGDSEAKELVTKLDKEEETITGAAKALRKKERRQERVERINEVAKQNEALPLDKSYPIILADPPWRYDYSPTDSRKIENQYPTMELDEICDLPVNELATPDAVLFLWATNPKLLEALEVIEAWGFEYRTNMVWVKDKIGMGYYARQRHELLLIAKRGKLPVPKPGVRHDSVLKAPRLKHSKKPELSYEVIEEMYPEYDKIELFSRERRSKWDQWGNETGESANV